MYADRTTYVKPSSTLSAELTNAQQLRFTDACREKKEKEKRFTVLLVVFEIIVAGWHG